MIKRIKKFFQVNKFIQDEDGSLDNLTWIIGSAVVVVLIIVVFMSLAPDTAEDVWDSFIDYATGEFGI